MARDRRGPGLALTLALAALGTARCVAVADHGVPTAEVVPAAFEARVHATGELKAARATPVELSPALRGVQRIAWLAPEGELVHRGDPLALLDQEQVLLDIKAARERRETIDVRLAAKLVELEQERRALASELEVLERERFDAETYAPTDEELFSRSEIIDARIDLELIRRKIEHCESRRKRHEERAAAEAEILRLQRQTEEVKLGQLEQSQSGMSIVAPHDAYFVHGRNWQREKIRVGMSLWPGMALGELPDTSAMEAKVFVLESEAAGLAPGAASEVVVDAHPTRVFRGKVKSVQPVANPIEQNSPVKYFEVLVALETTETAVMAPGSRVRATISVARDEGVVAVPNQAIFHEGEDTWVWVVSDGEFEKRPVAVGRRSASRTVVTQGLEPGEHIALVDPQAGA